MSAVSEPTGDRELCGKWMPVAGAPCGRKLDHAGKHVTAKALQQMVDNRPRKTSRKRGVRDPGGPARWNRAYKFKRLGITEERFLELLERQGYACAMCFEPFGDTNPQADHDPDCCATLPKARAKTCGCVRGLLCVGCNTALGIIRKYGELADAYLARVVRAGLEPATPEV